MHKISYQKSIKIIEAGRGYMDRLPWQFSGIHQRVISSHLVDFIASSKMPIVRALRVDPDPSLGPKNIGTGGLYP